VVSLGAAQVRREAELEHRFRTALLQRVFAAHDTDGSGND
jgi:hypothetical protein